jgi:GNAT superfamily N-acetyltransferase
MITFDGFKFMYHINNKLVGCYSVAAGLLYVDKEYRRKGIASQLVKARLELEPDYRPIAMSKAGHRLFKSMKLTAADVFIHESIENHWKTLDMDKFMETVSKQEKTTLRKTL